MQLIPSQVLRVIFVVTLIGSPPAFAQDQPSAADHRVTAPTTRAVLPSTAPTVLTGKERLGKKWMDEQRIDNCNVPLDKRGTKLRPDACSRGPKS